MFLYRDIDFQKQEAETEICAIMQVNKSKIGTALSDEDEFDSEVIEGISELEQADSVRQDEELN